MVPIQSPLGGFSFFTCNYCLMIPLITSQAKCSSSSCFCLCFRFATFISWALLCTPLDSMAASTTERVRCHLALGDLKTLQLTGHSGKLVTTAVEMDFMFAVEKKWVKTALEKTTSKMIWTAMKDRVTAIWPALLPYWTKDQTEPLRRAMKPLCDVAYLIYIRLDEAHWRKHTIVRMFVHT